MVHPRSSPNKGFSRLHCASSSVKSSFTQKKSPSLSLVGSLRVVEQNDTQSESVVGMRSGWSVEVERGRDRGTCKRIRCGCRILSWILGRGVSVSCLQSNGLILQTEVVIDGKSRVVLRVTVRTENLQRIYTETEIVNGSFLKCLSRVGTQLRLKKTRSHSSRTDVKTPFGTPVSLPGGKGKEITVGRTTSRNNKNRHREK